MKYLNYVFLGFTEESFRLLEEKSNQEREKGKDVFVSLVFDEVSIHKKIEWDGTSFVGCVDLGKQ